jgi:hypothetical protein
LIDLPAAEAPGAEDDVLVLEEPQPAVTPTIASSTTELSSLLILLILFLSYDVTDACERLARAILLGNLDRR